MSTFSNSPIPREDPVKVPAEDLTPTEPPKEPAETAEAAASALPAEESTGGEVQAAEEAVTSEGQAPEATEGDTVTETETAPVGEVPPSEPQKPQEPPMPWAIVVRHFTQAPAEAYRKLNTDFGLSLDSHGYARLQKLFRTVLKRDPTAGELCLLDALDRGTRDLPRREALGELYTDSPAIAEGDFALMPKQQLKLSYLPENTQLIAGDLILTSGLNGNYPSGLIIGAITELHTEASGMSRYAVIQPRVSLEQLKQVFVIKDFDIVE